MKNILNKLFSKKEKKIEQKIFSLNDRQICIVYQFLYNPLYSNYSLSFSYEGLEWLKEQLQKRLKRYTNSIKVVIRLERVVSGNMAELFYIKSKIFKNINEANKWIDNEIEYIKININKIEQELEDQINKFNEYIAKGIDFENKNKIIHYKREFNVNGKHFIVETKQLIS